MVGAYCDYRGPPAPDDRLQRIGLWLAAEGAGGGCGGERRMSS
jgi:hypothetical protein